MRAILLNFWLLSMLALFSSCSTPAVGSSGADSEPIIRAADGAEVSRAELLHAMSQSQVVYLGEKHDATRHHQLQLEIVRDLVQAGRRPAVGFETFALEQTSTLLDYVLADRDEDPAAEVRLEERLIEAIGGDRSDDGDWARYGELLRLARRHELVVFGADLSMPLRRRIGRKGLGDLTPVERRLLLDTGFESASYERLMRTIIRKAHCDWGSPEYLERMYQTWLARNDVMSMAISANLEARPDALVVMILGAGHVLYDMGVYERTAYRIPGIRQLNVAFRDRARADRPIAEQLRLMPEVEDQPSEDHQYVWFTQPARESPPDRCSGFLSGRHPQPSD